MKLSIIFILLVAVAQLATGQLDGGAQAVSPANSCPTQCNLASVIPQDGSSLVLGPAYSTIYVSAATVSTITTNSLTVAQPKPNWKVGTVLVLYQATGATVDISDPLSRNYGSIVSVGNAGNWEIVKIATVVDQFNFVLQCNLANTYDALLTTVVEPIIADQIAIMDGVQVVPAGLSGNGSIPNGVVPVIGNVITMGTNSKITATGKGFLGGVRGGVNTSIICMDCATTCKQLDYSYTERTWGARRGGSIAGDIDITFGRGAIANGGGGGNNHNAAGGGGANGWSDAAGVWTGDGVMDPAWTAAWILETSVLSTSIGGGRGGYSFSALKQDPLVNPPGDCIWQGNSRLNNGGLGGRPIKYFQNYETYTKLFLGGGGGAGHENDWVGGSGGNGGGFAIVIANQITATGTGATIEANGNPGDSSIRILTGPFDGSGGGGAGGSVFVVAYQSMSSGVSIGAVGGRGGDNNAYTTEEAEGGAGGGGGGVVSIAVPDTTANPCATVSVAGGSSGLQNGQTFFESFRPNGGTNGNSGQCLVLSTAPPCATTPTATISPSLSLSTSASTSKSTAGSGTRSGSGSGSSGSGSGSGSSGSGSGSGSGSSGSGSGSGNGSGVNNGGKGGKSGKKNASSPTPNHKKSHSSNKIHKNNNNNDESNVASIALNSLVIAVTSILFFAANQLH